MAAHLVVSPHYQNELLLDIVERFAMELPASIIWSKLDEAMSFGTMLNVALASGIPVSCLSYGAGLVNSLSPANKKMLFHLVFKHELPV